MISAEDKQLILKEYKIVQNSGISKTSFCKIIGLNRRTLQRWESGRIIDNRKGAAKRIRHKLSKEEEDKIINVCCSKRFADLNPYEIVAILAQEGIYIASESSIYRILRKNKLLKNRTGNKKRGSKKPEEIIASRPNELWSWDITYLKTKVRGVFYYLYVFMDIWSRKITAWGIFEEESGEHAKEILHEYCLREGITVNKIHSDNGAPMKSVIFLGLLEFLGVTKSFSRPRTSNDNAYSESLFKTVKYSAGFPGSFETIEKARDWFSNFRKWYNTEHLHSGIMYVTPEQRYNGTDKEILMKRDQTYLNAKTKNPLRWTKNCKKWKYEKKVFLNSNTKNSIITLEKIAC